jgi:hypothetical protein
VLATLVPRDDIPRDNAKVLACSLFVWLEGVDWRYRRSSRTGPNFFIPPMPGTLEACSLLDFRSAETGIEEEFCGVLGGAWDADAVVKGSVADPAGSTVQW